MPNLMSEASPLLPLHTFLSLKLLSKTFLNLRGTERDMNKNVCGLRVKYPLFLSDFNET
jgi:hypothetical protein